MHIYFFCKYVINIIIILLFIIKGFEENKNQINYIIKNKLNKKSEDK